jgi:hypothetical protein
VTNPTGDGQQPAAPDPGKTRQNIDLETENLIATYDTVAEWIRFADAKAAAVLTVAGALAGVLIPTLKEYLPTLNEMQHFLVDGKRAGRLACEYPTWRAVVIGLYAIWLALTVASCWQAFRCILPFRRKGEHPSLQKCAHFHPAAISRKYSIDDHDAFVTGYQQAGVSGFQEEVLAGLLIDSHISAAKYGHVTSAIRLLGWSAFVAMLYLLAIQF